MQQLTLASMKHQPDSSYIFVYVCARFKPFMVSLQTRQATCSVMPADSMLMAIPYGQSVQASLNNCTGSAVCREGFERANHKVPQKGKVCLFSSTSLAKYMHMHEW